MPAQERALLTKTFEAEAWPVRLKPIDETDAGPPMTVSVKASNGATQPALTLLPPGSTPAATLIEGVVTVTVVPAEEAPDTVKPTAATRGRWCRSGAVPACCRSRPPR